MTNINIQNTFTNCSLIMKALAVLDYTLDELEKVVLVGKY